jgi:hypothetical protein
MPPGSWRSSRALLKGTCDSAAACRAALRSACEARQNEAPASKVAARPRAARPACQRFAAKNPLSFKALRASGGFGVLTVPAIRLFCRIARVIKSIGGKRANLASTILTGRASHVGAEPLQGRGWPKKNQELCGRRASAACARNHRVVGTATNCPSPAARVRLDIYEAFLYLII